MRQRDGGRTYLSPVSEEQTPEPGRAVWRRREFNRMKNRTALIPNNAHPKHHTVLSYNSWSFARLMNAAAVSLCQSLRCRDGLRGGSLCWHVHGAWRGRPAEEGVWE